MTTSANPNQGHWSPPPTVTHSTDTRKKGDLIRILRGDGGVDLVEIVSTWTSARYDIPMLTVVRRPYGVFSFDVRADAVLADDAPDVRHDATECTSECETHRAERAAAERMAL